MATKKAKKKSTTANVPHLPKFHRVTIHANATFSPDPVKNVKHGDFVQILTPPNSAVDIKWIVTVKQVGVRVAL
jgi:hypothetical protein